MKILIVNGSPKGKNSVTLQTALYLEKRFPAHQFDFIHVGARIRALEKDFSEAKAQMEGADILIFTYPVYTFIAPYQLHRFIELTKESGANLKDKYAAQITTSKHFFDVTAFKCIEENCYDLGMRYLETLPADMDDIRTKQGKLQADSFFEKIIFDIENEIYKTKEPYAPTPRAAYEATLPEGEKSDDKDVLVVTNAAADDLNLLNMIEEFKRASKYKVRVANVREFPFKGGCLGCTNCAQDGTCVYKDGFSDYLRNDIQKADAFIYAFSIENHYTHSSFKCYDDRQFCNGHRTVTAGKVTGYIISGDYSREENLHTIVEARADVSEMYFAGIATDETDTQKSIIDLAKVTDLALEKGFSKPQSFYGVGGTKIFRDLVYLMQGIMRADHKFYKEHGIYDFPQKKRGTIFLMKLLGGMLKSKAVRKKIGGHMTEYMLMPYAKALDNVEPK